MIDYLRDCFPDLRIGNFSVQVKQEKWKHLILFDL